MRIGKNNYIQQLQLHNEDALIYVIETYAGLLKSVIRKHLYKVPDKVDECLNDVLLSIWKHMDSFDESKNTFPNWAAAIARYKAIDYLRKYQQELQQVNIEDIVVPKEDTMLEKLLEQEISEEIQALMSCMSKKDRELFWKIYVEEKTMEEVSRETGMKRAAIYNHLSRGKRRMRKQYLKKGEA
ncbi:MAG: sigma-70 family RNA polymerase sigma factor [Lachnospiraceae bacterium]|nr:sigma-70 family RNA polymerase sigma factor [Lachnospiraceae bacterium]